MSQVIINDGSGSGRAAIVDSKKRLATTSTTQSDLVSATKSGNAYILNTGVITLTSANASAVLYLKSNEDSALVVTNVIVNCGVSTGGTGDVIRTDFISPSTGTLITDATLASVQNLNASSSNTLSADVFIGAEGKTVGGTPITAAAINHLSQSNETDVGLVFPKGAAIGTTLTPPAGNTSLNVSMTIVLYLLDEA